MNKAITPEIVVAYSQCPRKAFLFLFSEKIHALPEYVQLLKQRCDKTQKEFLKTLSQQPITIKSYTPDLLNNAYDVLFDVTLTINGFAADCTCLRKAEGQSVFGNFCYEPTICTGTYSMYNEQKIRLLYIAYVLEQIQQTPIKRGHIITYDGKAHRIKLKRMHKILSPFLNALKTWETESHLEQPPLLLKKACLTCQLQDACRSKALQGDHLSRLDRMTPKTISKYEKKGIFTVKQLSYVFKPRRRRKDAKKSIEIHNLELQALALREQKVYVQTLPTIKRQPTELFIDIEGIPDQQFYYLFGLLVSEGEHASSYSFWATSPSEEENSWQQFLHQLNQQPNAPIYHYGSYETRAMTKLAKRYGVDITSLNNRFVNVNTFIHAKIYFPVYSNSLKEIGAFVGATWTASNASGLQSLVWRYKWEQTLNIQYKQLLLTYNTEDCRALKFVLDKLSKIAEYAQTLDDVDFADKRKQQLSNIGQDIYNQFDVIRKLSYFAYKKKKISFSQPEPKISKEKKRESAQRSARKSQQKREVARQKVTRVIEVARGEICPVCGHHPLHQTENLVKRTLIDIVSNKNGLRKTLTRYIGFQGYCKKCGKYYSPPDIRKYPQLQLYGHGFNAWIVYQRVALRLPYSSIHATAKDYFNQDISKGHIPDIVKAFGSYYQETEKRVTQHLLENHFIHADETRISIQGESQYVWVFTDGKHVIFKLTKTREATIVHEFLTGYEGVLISDFYPGYDSVQCWQQKCWGHLIRDINDDLLESPFDTEFETFAWEVKNLIVPIMKTVQKYGLKVRHLHKFQKNVQQFYTKIIIDHDYRSELAQRYQKRFIRYNPFSGK